MLRATFLRSAFATSCWKSSRRFFLFLGRKPEAHAIQARRAIGNCMKGDLRFVVPALAGSGFIPPKGGTTNVSRRSMQYPGKRGISAQGSFLRVGSSRDIRYAQSSLACASGLYDSTSATHSICPSWLFLPRASDPTRVAAAIQFRYKPTSIDNWLQLRVAHGPAFQ